MEANVDRVVDIKSREAAQSAIQMLDGLEFRGRKIVVREVIEFHWHWFHAWHLKSYLSLNQNRKQRKIG